MGSVSSGHANGENPGHALKIRERLLLGRFVCIRSERKEAALSPARAEPVTSDAEALEDAQHRGQYLLFHIVIRVQGHVLLQGIGRILRPVHKQLPVLLAPSSLDYDEGDPVSHAGDTATPHSHLLHQLDMRLLVLVGARALGVAAR